MKTAGTSLTPRLIRTPTRRWVQSPTYPQIALNEAAQVKNVFEVEAE
jgi:hypothetical protein